MLSSFCFFFLIPSLFNLNHFLYRILATVNVADKQFFLSEYVILDCNSATVNAIFFL